MAAKKYDWIHDRCPAVRPGPNPRVVPFDFNPVGPPIVTVFGAGIAGLTAAHELIERGFAVQVVEPAQNQRAPYDVLPGGMAANQFCFVPEHEHRLFPFYFKEQNFDSARYVAELQGNIGINQPILDLDAIESVFGAPSIPNRPPIAPDNVDAAKELLWRLLNVPMKRTRGTHPFPDRVAFDQEQERKHERAFKNALKKADTAIAAAKKNGDEDGFKKAIEQWIDAATKYLNDPFDFQGLYERIAKAYRDHKKHADRDLAQAWDGPVDQQLSERIRRRWTMVFEIHAIRRSTDEFTVNLWADRVRTILIFYNQLAENPIDDFERHLVVIHHESRFSLSRLAQPGSPEGDEVGFRLLGHDVPGEHGYRFFPSFYRHLFDTMRRTPILDEAGVETMHTSFDHLRPTPTVEIALEDDAPPRSVPRRKAQSLEELRKSMRVFMKDMGFTSRDMLRWSVRILKFMTASSERRREYESETWWEFIGGDTPRPRGYSARAKRYLLHTPQALLAMSAEESDARSQGDVSVQLLIDQSDPDAGADMTLVGSTSEAWLQHWKRYLKRQGVRFFLGAIEGLTTNADGEVVANAVGPGPDCKPILEDEIFDSPPKYETKYIDHDSEGATPSFYVLAVPYHQAADLVQDLTIPLELDFAKLDHFDEKTKHPRPDNMNRDPKTGKPDHPDHLCIPFRDLSGIQFYFPNQVRVGHGHVYYGDSPWGLSSISQLAYWLHRLPADSPFLGQVSVDIGDFYTSDRSGAIAWRSTDDTIARHTWLQILMALEPFRGANLVEPSFYHLDDYLRFEANGDRRNDAPFLINLTGQWPLRPGVVDRSFLYGPPSGHGHGAEIQYSVSHKRWVLCGTYMGTYTRITTMEAANESGRHAVNAILHRLMTARGGYDSAGRLLGDLAEIWNPEDHELDDLAPLKRLDKALHDEGLPHFMDILDIPNKLDEREPVADMISLLDQTLRDDWDLARDLPRATASPLLYALKHQPVFEQLMKMLRAILSEVHNEES